MRTHRSHWNDKDVFAFTLQLMIANVSKMNHRELGRHSDTEWHSHHHFGVEKHWKEEFAIAHHNRMVIICTEKKMFFFCQSHCIYVPFLWWLHQRAAYAFFFHSRALATDHKLFRVHNTNVFADNSINFRESFGGVYVACVGTLWQKASYERARARHTDSFTLDFLLCFVFLFVFFLFCCRNLPRRTRLCSRAKQF